MDLLVTPSGIVHLVQHEVRRTITAELERLARRTQLGVAEVDTVAESLARLSSVLVLDHVAAWQGDYRVVADLFDLPTTSECEGIAMPKLTGGATVAEHKAATREAMLDAFAVEFHENGWEGVKLQTIAEKAGVARTAVYNYFPDKTALLMSWSEREMTRFIALAQRELEDRADPLDRLQVLIKLVLIEFSLQRGVGESVASALSPKDREQFVTHIAPLVELVEALLRDGMDHGVFEESDPTDTGRLVMACLETQRSVLIAGGRPDEAVARTLPFILRALGASPEGQGPEG
ncbi:TetR/AcrR family transcriptional regulator [Rhodococcus sp. F64268]|uniref:TetR/AcrR family transcriptional regulator n=1 Tax=unclassified Rhodococcus (in: high G+C Gram-positive bacteria) TaxID=192944 RepID=UPI001FF1EDD8|nr:TetR/AcrR family transcriptional regulator [Rhodococcus sp. F64268]MCK0090158.1 TetR/AcrR family transcriptional regulator [Rhodococcus sp. F64268]